MLTTLAVAAHPVLAHPVMVGAGRPGWWIVFPLLWFALFATALVLFVRRRRTWAASVGPWARAAGPNPVAVLGERYARGEIDEREYRTRLAVLREDQPQR